MATPTLKKPILSLDTLTERDYITIDGQAYDLLKPQQLSLVAYNRVQPLVPRFDELMNVGTLDAETAAELAQILERICADVLVAPPEVQARLLDEQRLQIVVAFAGLSQLLRLLSRTPNETPQATTTTRATGATPSRASAASMPARRRRTGSSARR